MNYKESRLILKKIKKAKRILVNCHPGPDPDSIGSALALYKILKEMKKSIEIVCPSEEMFENVSYLENYQHIKKGVDFSSLDFSKYDLLVTLDSSSWDMVAGYKNFKKPDIRVIQIDHHNTNTFYGDINLVDKTVTSTAELLYLVFRDWKTDIGRVAANCLMTGIIGDTGAFRFPGSNQRTLQIASELMKRGADKEEIIYHIYRSEPFNLLKFYGEALMRLNLDKRHKFVWAAIPYEVFKKLEKPLGGRESVSSLFAQVTDGTEFGFAAVEQEPKKLSVSFRSRTGFDTSKIAAELGGGGHIYASGAKVEGLPFDKAVEKVVRVARKHAKKNKN